MTLFSSAGGWNARCQWTDRLERVTGLIALSLVLGLNLAEAQSPAPAAPAAQSDREIIIVFKTHFDIGYTDLASNIVQRYRTVMIDKALQCVEASRTLPPQQQFAWTIPGWPLHKILEDWPGQTPERQHQVLQAFKEGRFVVHALPFSTHTELLEPEDLVRGLGYSARLSRQLGLALPRDAKMTDVPCHSWFVPTLLRRAGVDFLHLGCNAASQSPSVPRLFWWEGPDGSRLLTMYTAEGYGTGLVPPPDWPWRTWLALIQTGDNHGPPQPEETQKLLAEARQQLPGAKVRIGRMSDFADELLAEHPQLPVIHADMPDTWIHGPLCDPIGARTARTIRPALGTAEALNTQLRFWGAEAPEAAATLAQAYEQSLLYGEHTWGGALSWVLRYSQHTPFPYGAAWQQQRAQGRFQRLEASWDEHSAYIAKAAALVSPLLASEMQGLARQVQADGTRIVVYNPLPWKRDGLVSLNAAGQTIRALRPLDGKGVAPVASQGDTLQFLAREVPPMGYRTFVPVTPRQAKSGLHYDAALATLENEFFKATLDPARGAIRSLLDKHTGRELVDPHAAHGFGQYLYERFDADQVAAYVKAYVKINTDWAVTELGKPSLPPAKEAPYRALSPRECQVRFEQSPVAVAAVLEAPASAELPCAVTTRFSLPAGQPYLEMEVTLHDKPADPWPEAGWICLPVQVPNPQFRLGRLGSIVDPAKDIVPGANHFLYGINGGLTITDSRGRGVGICPLDSPLVSLDRPGCWQYAQEFTPKKPAAYINLFNNQWSTNFRLWNRGTWSSRVRVWALGGEAAEAALVSPSLEARYPLQAAVASGRAGALPPSRAGLELSRKGILVTAFGPDPDGAGTLLRLWEYAGKSGPCQVRLPEGVQVQQVQPVDLRGQPLGPPRPVKHRQFQVPIEAFAPVTVRF